MRTHMIGLFLGLGLSGAAVAQTNQPSGPPGHGGPPQEAFAACSGKSQGDSCSVKFGDREMSGTCELPPPSASDSRLACKPSGPPPR